MTAQQPQNNRHPCLDIYYQPPPPPENPTMEELEQYRAQCRKERLNYNSKRYYYNHRDSILLKRYQQKVNGAGVPANLLPLNEYANTTVRKLRLLKAVDIDRYNEIIEQILEATKELHC